MCDTCTWFGRGITTATCKSNERSQIRVSEALCSEVNLTKAAVSQWKLWHHTRMLQMLFMRGAIPHRMLLPVWLLPRQQHLLQIWWVLMLRLSRLRHLRIVCVGVPHIGISCHRCVINPITGAVNIASDVAMNIDAAATMIRDMNEDLGPCSRHHHFCYYHEAPNDIPPLPPEAALAEIASSEPHRQTTHCVGVELPMPPVVRRWATTLLQGMTPMPSAALPVAPQWPSIVIARKVLHHMCVHTPPPSS